MDKKEMWVQSGSKLKELRKATGMSVFKVGRAIGVSGSYVSQFERGVCAPSDAALIALANLYGVDKQTLFDLYKRIEDEEANRLMDNPMFRKVFTQITSDKKLSQNDKDEIVKELERIAQKYSREDENSEL